MPSAVPPLMVLPEIVKVIQHRIPIFVDCGIESGLDAFKALALGADAVCVGRHLMPLLKTEGAVAARLREMTGELKSIMARTGAKSIREIDPTVLHFRSF
jgi:isopentenyl diphosphate isomerase/L-lactate dehydrogenase-like FMN-dependent dehydrogenase